MTEKLKAITTTDARCETLYLDKTGCPAETVRKWCNTELLMTPELACKNGIIHDVKPLKIPPNAFFHQVVV